MPEIALAERIWYGGGTTTIRPPDDWVVEVHHMRGAGRPPLAAEAIVRALEQPTGAPPLRELARGRRKAVILFDDLTRPTPASRIAPLVVDALLAGGIPEDRITFVCALGAHGPLGQGDLRKKLGSDLVERFRVYNHDWRGACVHVGTTSRGTQVLVNREVMSADLKVGIGAVTAHPNAGFSGGGKVIVPGVAGRDTIVDHHIRLMNAARAEIGFGRHAGNVLRVDMDEAARLAGLDFKIDLLFDENAVATDVFAGAFAPAHAEAVRAARRIYALDRTPAPKDVAIVNAVAKPNEMLVSYLAGQRALAPRDHGTIVVLANAPDGQVVHYLLGRFGEGHGGPKYPSVFVPDRLRLVVQAPSFDRTFGDWFANPDAITWTRDWDGTLVALRQWHGAGTTAVVLPAGDLAFYPG